MAERIGLDSRGARGRWLRFLPIVERELRIAARGKAAHRWRTTVAAAALGLMALMTASLTAERTEASAHGRVLFNGLLLVSVLYAVFASVAVTADSISREKREGTLGLLFLTELRGLDIIFGKLAASSLNTVYGLIGLLPLLAVPVMMGGVSIRAGVLATVAVLNVLFVSLSFGILVSSISWNERRATFAAFVSVLVLFVGPLLLSGVWVVFFGARSPYQLVMSGLSPIFPALAVLPSPVGPLSFSPYLAILPSHLIGWLALLISGRLVESAWHSRSGSPVRRTVDEQVFTPRDPARRSGHRRRMLEIHPLVWLLERHPGKRFYADGLVVAIFIIWAWGYRTYGTGMFGGPGWFLTAPLAFAVHLILSSWMVAETSMQILQDKRSGALELLLCTTLTDREIIQGHRLTLRRLFLRPLLMLAAAEVFIAFNGFGHAGEEGARSGMILMLAMATAVLLDTHALSWIGLRLAVSLPNVNRVGLYALGITPLAPLLFTACVATVLALLPLPGFRVSFGVVIALWIASFVFVDVVIGEWLSRRAVMRKFRAFATDAEDPIGPEPAGASAGRTSPAPAGTR